jgi:hypothetical protein
MKRLSILFCFTLIYTVAKAQQENTAEPTLFSLKQAIDYGLNENYTVKNSNLQKQTCFHK